MNDIKIQLNPNSILKIPLEKYDKNFTFIVNGEKFCTNRVIADLLSPKICQIHFNDPTFDEFTIQTSEKGNFSYVLDLALFNQVSIPETEVPFIAEIIEIFDNESIKTNKIDRKVTITIDNVFNLIKNHEKYDIFHSKMLQDEIDFLSSHFFLIDDDKVNEIIEMKMDTLEMIIKNPKLQLKSEDQLITIINQLYTSNSKYSFLYEFVDFSNVSVNKITEFLSIYDIKDLTHDSWKNLSSRLEKQIFQNNEINNNNHRYHNVASNSEKVNNDLKKGISIQYDKNKEFNGIINYLSNKSKSSIYDDISITSSSTFWSHSPRNTVLYDDHSKYFFSQNKENSWICFNFKEHKIVPKNYTLRSHDNSANCCHPKNWVLEGSNDGNYWEIINEQENCSLLNGSLLSYTFQIQNLENKEFQFIRMRQTQSCWDGSHNLSIDSIEFYGTLK